MSESEIFTCPHGSRCGGCAFLGVPYEQQLVQKGALVRRAFERFPEHAALRVDPVLGASPTVGYRVRAKLVWGEGGALGLFARDSHAVVDIPECRMLAPPLLRVAAVARSQLGGGVLALDGLDLRLVDRGVLVTLIARRGTPLPELERAAQALCAASQEVVGVAASFRDAHSATVLGAGHVLLVGSEVETHHLEALGPYHLAAHGAFTQAHPGQAVQAHQVIERLLRELSAQRVLELYAGSAALALNLASSGFELTAVEAFAPALAQAARAASEQNLPLCSIQGPAERVTRELCARGERFDAIIVNPPRRGLSVDVRHAVAELEPRAVLYMSCNPGTLARDLGHFRELGFVAQTLSPLDMIPYSDAVECLVVARRGAQPELRPVHEDDELIALNRSAYDSSAPRDFLSRVRALPGAREAVPLGQLDGDCSGLALFARRDRALPSLTAALAAGGQTFIGLARGVTHKKGRIRRPLKGKRQSTPPTTRYQRSALHGGHSLLKIEPSAADSGQIRQHFAGIGHPILGDARYGDAASNSFFEHRHGLDRSFLHCSSLWLTRNSVALELEAPLPGELANVLASLSEQAAPRG